MGLVFLAEHTRVGRKVTLKILAPEFASAGVALPAVTLSTRVVGLGRLELPTSPLSGVRSNHLSYRPTARQEVLVTLNHDSGPRMMWSSGAGKAR